MTGLLDWLGSLVSPSKSDPAPATVQAPLPTADPGSTAPQLQSYEDFRNSPQQWGEAYHNGLGNFLGMLFGGGASPQAYNAMLRDAQATKLGQLNTAGYEGLNPGAGGTPAQLKAPSSVIGAPTPDAAVPDASPVAQAPPAPGLLASLTSGQDASVAAPAGPAMLTGAPAPGATSGGFGPAQIMQRIQRLNFPGGLAAQAPLLSALETMMKQGISVDGSGKIVRVPGANSADYQTEQSKSMGKDLLGFNADGSIANLPGVVAAASGKAGAVKGAETTAANLSDLTFKPLIEGDIAKAKLPALFADQGNQAWLKSLSDWSKPTETRPGNDVVSFNGGQPGRSAFMNPGAVPSSIGGMGVGGGASGPAVGDAGGTRTLYSNNGESFETGKQLAKETAESRMVADNAYQQRTLYGKMLGAVDGATLGSEADRRGKLVNLVATLTGFDGPSAAKATQNQVFDKMATQVAGQATTQLDQTAVAALQTMRNAYPNREMTPQALKEMIGQLSGFQTYLVQKDVARNDYIKTHGTAAGFVQGDWMRTNTPDRFVDAGIKAARAGTLTGDGALPLQQFKSPTDPNLALLKSGTHFLDANGVERVKP